MKKLDAAKLVTISGKPKTAEASRRCRVKPGQCSDTTCREECVRFIEVVGPLGNTHPDLYRQLEPPEDVRLFVSGRTAVLAQNGDEAFRFCQAAKEETLP